MDFEEERSLITKVLNGQTERFGVLIDHYKHLVFTLVFRVLKNENDAKDISQEVFIKAYQNLGKFKGDAKFSTWISSIAFRQAIDFKKKNERNNKVDFNRIDERSTENSFHHESEYKERQELITGALNTLKPMDSIIVTLYYLDEMSLQEISAVVNISVNNLKARLFKARKSLKEFLQRNMNIEITDFYGK